MIADISEKSATTLRVYEQIERKANFFCFSEMQPLIAAKREFMEVKSDFPMKFGNLGTNLMKFI